MTTIGDILDRSRTDILDTAANRINRVDAGLRRGNFTVEGPDLDGIRDIDIGDLLQQGWSSYRELEEAARDSLAQPGEVKNVSLHEVTLAFTYNAALVLSYDRTPILRAPFKLSIVVGLLEFDALVRDGCLRAIQAQAMTIHIELTIGPKDLSSDPVELVPAEELRLGRGIPLVRGVRC
jgi:hypothetical protein